MATTTLSSGTKPSVAKINNGTFGKVYINNTLCYEVSKASATVKPSRETVAFAGDMMNDSKIVALDCEFSFTVQKVYTRGQTIAENFKAGNDPRFNIIMRLENPSNGNRYEQVSLSNCWFSDISIANFEHGKLIEEEFSGGFTDYDITSTMADNWTGE